MKDEFLYVSIAGIFGLFAAGFLLGIVFATDKFEAGHVFLAIMLLVLVRKDVREGPAGGVYKQGWFVWRRTGPSLPSAQEFKAGEG